MIHGGLYGEGNEILNDFACYDIALGMWIRIKVPKADRAVLK